MVVSAARGRAFFPAFILLLAAAGPALSAPLPKATQEVLGKLNVDASLLADIDKELQVPQQWIEGAKKEGRLLVRSTTPPNQMKALFAPFEERYPYISINYGSTTGPERIKILVAYRARRILTDILSPIGLDDFLEWEKGNGLEDLRDIPGFRHAGDIGQGPGGLVVGIYTLYRCVGYNTKLVAKADLPKKWEDLLDNPRWRNGKLALGNRTIWLAPLWKAKGEKWARDYVNKLFHEVRPQRRKEGLNSLVELLSAGEFDAVMPANNGDTYERAMRGAPVGFVCPDPAPLGIGYAGILKGAPHVNSARIFLNWLLSKEGQIVQYATRKFSPIRKDLMRPELVPFSDAVFGRQVTFDDFDFSRQAARRIDEVWNAMWVAK